MSANKNEGNENKIVYKELSYAIVGCFYKVYNTLGPGHKEGVYQKALSMEFDKQNICYDGQKKIQLKYEGKTGGVYKPDFIIEDRVIIEIKSVLMMPKVYEKQLVHYLKSSGYKLGFLVNFGAEKTEIARRVN